MNSRTQTEVKGKRTTTKKRQMRGRKLVGKKPEPTQTHTHLSQKRQTGRK